MAFSGPGSLSSILVKVNDSSSGLVHTIDSLTVDADASQLKSELFRLTSVPPDKQILLVGPPFSKLKSNAILIETIRSKQVYLYDARVLDGGTEATVVVTPITLDYQIPSDRDYVPPAPPQGSLSPMQRAVADFAAQISFQRTQAEGWATAATARVQSIGGLGSQLEVLCDCVNVASENLAEHWAATSTAANAFAVGLKEESTAHGETLASFESSLSRLATIRLHPALVKEDMTTLLSCLPVDRLREWHARCEGSMENIAVVADRLASAMIDLQSSIASETALRFDDSCNKEVRQSALDASKSLAHVKSLVEKVRDSSIAASERVTAALEDPSGALESCRVLSEVFDTNRKERLAACEVEDNRLRALQEQLLMTKASVVSQVTQRLRAISTLQSSIRAVNAQMMSLRDSAAAQSAAIDELRHVEAMPAAYKACLGEVVRRRVFERMYVCEVESAADKLSRLRAAEVQARETFLRRHGRHLPKHLVHGLNDRPPHVEILTRPFDTALPAIDPESLDSPIPVESPSSGSGNETPHAAPTAPGNDDLSREQALALQHENAALKAQLLSITALCSDPFSGINVKRPKSVGKPGDEGKDGGPPQKVSTLRAVSLDICERATALSLQPAQEDTPVISQADAPGLTAAAAADLTQSYKAAVAEIAALKRQLTASQNLRDRISYRAFDVGDVAMFFPVPLPSPDGGGDRRVYIAFNEHCPNRYLADGSTSEFKATGRYPTYVIGRIVRIEGSVAGSGGGNPYLLPAGTPYFVVTVSAVEWG